MAIRNHDSYISPNNKSAALSDNDFSQLHFAPFPSPTKDHPRISASTPSVRCHRTPSRHEGILTPPLWKTNPPAARPRSDAGTTPMHGTARNDSSYRFQDEVGSHHLKPGQFRHLFRQEIEVVGKKHMPAAKFLLQIDLQRLCLKTLELGLRGRNLCHFFVLRTLAIFPAVSRFPANASDCHVFHTWLTRFSHPRHKMSLSAQLMRPQTIGSAVFHTWTYRQSTAEILFPDLRHFQRKFRMMFQKPLHTLLIFLRCKRTGGIHQHAAGFQHFCRMT